jgi:hypothetical protein
LRKDERGLAGGFLLGAQTPGADVDALPFALDDDGGFADIGQPAPLGMALGVGYVIPDLWFLATQLTLQRLLLLTRALFSCRIQFNNITQIELI